VGAVSVEVGVTSFGGDHCSTNQRSYFTAVPPIYNWISGVVQNAGSSLPHAPSSSGGTTGGYRGRTSQNRNVSFTVSGGKVRSFSIVVGDRCPDGHVLNVH